MLLIITDHQGNDSDSDEDDHNVNVIDQSINQSINQSVKAIIPFQNIMKNILHTIQSIESYQFEIPHVVETNIMLSAWMFSNNLSNQA